MIHRWFKLIGKKSKKNPKVKKPGVSLVVVPVVP